MITVGMIAGYAIGFVGLMVAVLMVQRYNRVKWQLEDTSTSLELALDAVDVLEREKVDLENKLIELTKKPKRGRKASVKTEPQIQPPAEILKPKTKKKPVKAVNAPEVKTKPEPIKKTSAKKPAKVSIPVEPAVAEKQKKTSKKVK